MIYESIQDFPKDLCMTDVVLRSVNVVGQQTGPFNHRREIQVFPGARWEMEITFLPANRSDSQRLESWILSLRGIAGRFRIGDPWRSLPLGTNFGAPVVVSAIAGHEEFSTGGWIANGTSLLVAGDYIQIGDRLHRVLRDVNSNAVGVAAVTVWPALRESHATGSPVITRNARGIFAKSENADEFARNRHDFSTYTMRAVEVV